MATNAAGVVPSVLLLNVILHFVFFFFVCFLQTDLHCCCCQSSKRKVEWAQCWIKGVVFIYILCWKGPREPDVVLVVLCSRRSSSPVYSRTNTTQRNAAKNAPAMADFQEVIKKFEVVMPQTWVFSISVALSCRLDGIGGGRALLFCTAASLCTAAAAGLLIKSLCTPTQVSLITLIRPRQVQWEELLRWIILPQISATFRKHHNHRLIER